MINKQPLCIIHVGLHHTGTTTFQCFLNKYSKILKNYSILYPETGVYGNQHSLFPGSYLKDHKSLPKDRSYEIDSYLKNLSKELSHYGSDICILSSEVFTELLQNNPDKVIEIINKFENLFSKIYIFITTRESKTRAISQLKAKLRLSMNNLHFRKEIYNAHKLFDSKIIQSKVLINKWKSLNKNVIVNEIDPKRNLIKSNIKCFYPIIDEKNLTQIKNLLASDNIYFDLNSNVDPYCQSIYLIFLCVATVIFNRDKEIENKLNISIIINYYNQLSDEQKFILSEINKEHLIKFINIRKEFDVFIKEKPSDIVISTMLFKLELRYKLFYYLKKSINDVLAYLVEIIK